jgi:molybdopterin-guanine dinucleotide biosynthesis protein MobB
MNDSVIIGFYGTSNSGKTLLITKIISWLKSSGYKVATVKLTNKELSLDTKGKDTDRYKVAGSDVVVFSSLIETTIIQPKSLNIADIITTVNDGSIDVVIIEGANDKKTSKIRIDEQSSLRENTLWTYHDDVDKIKIYLEHKLTERRNKMANYIELKVNGKNIPLTEFPKEFIEHTIEGMISSLKGVDEIETIEISIKKKK